MIKSHYNQVAGRDNNRSIALSDGIFAVAITLLFLDIRVPLQENVASDFELINLFTSLKPKFIVAFLAFMTIGIFWTGHSVQYQYITKSDRNLSWINLLFLLSVIILPFSTSFLGNYIDFIFPMVIYWFNLLIMGLLLYLHWNYAYKKGLIDEEKKDLVSKPIKTRIIIAQSLYFIGALLCFFNPYISIAFIILVQLNYAFAFINGIKS